MENTINDCYVDVVGEKPSNEQIRLFITFYHNTLKTKLMSRAGMILLLEIMFAYGLEVI